jgi:zinc protease
LEYQKLQNAFETEFYSSNSSMAGIAEALANNYVYFGNTNLINSELERYKKVTREDIREAAKNISMPINGLFYIIYRKVNKTRNKIFP